MAQFKAILARILPHTRIIIPVICSLAVMIVVLFAFIIPAFRTGIIEKKKDMVRQQAYTVWSVLAYYHELEEDGGLTQGEAQSKAKDEVRRLRYGNDMKDYFWINDTLPVMIMHPYRSDLDGQDVSTFADSNGKRLFVEFARLATTRGEGFVDYMWQWKDDASRIVPKVSFIKVFEPWGWVVGTGVYIDDVEAEIAYINRGIVISLLCAFWISVLISLYIIRSGMKTEFARQAAVDALSASERQYRTLAENSSECIIRLDSHGRPLYVNPAWLKIMGRDRNAIMNKSISELGFDDEYVSRWQNMMASVLREIRPARMEIEFDKFDGGKIVQDWRIVPEMDESNLATTVLGVARDITDIRAAEAKLMLFNDKLKVANAELLRHRKELEEFLHTVSHDLKAPIISIQGFAQLLKKRIEGRVGDTSLSFLDRIATNCRVIEALLSDLLKLAQIGRIEESLTAVDMAALIDEVIEEFDVMAGSNSIVIRREKTFPEVFGRPNRIRQVLSNLVDNAIKYVPEKPDAVISIGCRPDQPAPHSGHTVFFVRDNGDGIALKDQGKIFLMFQRARQNAENRTGSGAGLAIVKKIIESHGGAVWVESSPGNGATFYFTLPSVNCPNRSGAIETSPHMATMDSPIPQV